MYQARSVVPVVLSTIAIIGSCAAVSAGSWSLEEIAGDIGDFSWVAVAVDSHTGDIFIAYYLIGTGDLWLARTVSQDGNCGPGNTWRCQEIISGGDVGRYCSIAVRSNPGGQAEFIIP